MSLKPLKEWGGFFHSDPHFRYDMEDYRGIQELSHEHVTCHNSLPNSIPDIQMYGIFTYTMNTLQTTPRIFRR